MAACLTAYGSLSTESGGRVAQLCFGAHLGSWVEGLVHMAHLPGSVATQTCYARILDAKRRFLEAALRCVELRAVREAQEAGAAAFAGVECEVACVGPDEDRSERVRRISRAQVLRAVADPHLSSLPAQGGRSRVGTAARELGIPAQHHAAHGPVRR